MHIPFERQRDVDTVVVRQGVGAEDVVGGIFCALSMRLSSLKTSLPHASTTVTKMSSSRITIELPFLEDLSGLEFLEEFDNQPLVSDQEFVEAFVSLQVSLSN